MTNPFDVVKTQTNHPGLASGRGRPKSFKDVPTKPFDVTHIVQSRAEIIYHIRKHRGTIFFASQLFVDNTSTDFVSFDIKRDSVITLLDYFSNSLQFYCYNPSEGNLIVYPVKHLSSAPKLIPANTDAITTDSEQAETQVETRAEAQGSVGNTVTGLSPLVPATSLSPTLQIGRETNLIRIHEDGTPVYKEVPKPTSPNDPNYSDQGLAYTEDEEVRINKLNPIFWDPTHPAMPKLDDDEFDLLSDDLQEQYSEALAKWHKKFENSY